MYLCMYVSYVYMYICIYLEADMYICIYQEADTYMCIYLQADRYMCIYLGADIYTCINQRPICIHVSIFRNADADARTGWDRRTLSLVCLFQCV
jgi:uncharacterized protein (DUF1919 family)